MLLLAVASGNFPLAQLVEGLDTQTEGPWFEFLQWRLIYLLHVFDKPRVDYTLTGPSWEQFQSAQVPSQLAPRSVLVCT